jgi:methylmalonyl-CoA mutase
MGETKRERLFNEFPPVSAKEWEEKIRADLKGADYQKKLIWNTPEGFQVKPYYRQEDLNELDYLRVFPGDFPFTRGEKIASNAWNLRQDINDPDPAEANKKALEAIERECSEVGFNVNGITSDTGISRMLEGIDIGKTAIHFTRARSFPGVIEMSLAVAGSRKTEPGKLRGSLGSDPVISFFSRGKYLNSRQNDLDESFSLLKTTGEKLPGFRSITIHGDLFQNAGSTLSQELAFALAAGNEYLAGLISRGSDAETVSRYMTFTFALGPDFFMEIAKLRAARLLWAEILAQYRPGETPPSGMHIHCRTATWNMSVYDPYVNMLRATTEGMSGVLGGADSIEILPFDHAFKYPDHFSERIARNQQLLMREESYLDKIVDPSAGSYYIETLTHLLAQKSWEIFLSVEAGGGILDCGEKGIIQEMVSESRNKKESDAAEKKLILLGTNQYPNSSEQMNGKIIPEETEPVPFNESEKILRPFRAGEPFEKLRLSTEKFIAEGNPPPIVFLLTMGSVSMMRARAGFSANFFGCAGYRIIDNPGFRCIDDGVKAAIESAAQIVVICSSDEEYRTIVPDACRGIKEKLPGAIIVVAGYPKESITELKEAGVDEFIHIRNNIPETLAMFNKRLGIPDL